MSQISVTYNGNTIYSSDDSTVFKLNCKGKKMESDVVVTTGSIVTDLSAEYCGQVITPSQQSHPAIYTFNTDNKIMKDDLTVSVEVVLPYLSFTSPTSFTVESNAGTKTWTNQLEYSTDGQSWSEWDGSTISSGVHKGSNAIYMRGTGNQVISGGEDDNNRWNFTGSDITISGNIEWILDYQTVMNGQHPVMGTYCYRSLFYGNTALITCPELPATDLTDSCYRSMFDRCTSIVNPPELPATVMAPNCYRSMFYSGTSLVAAPEINTSSLAEACFKYMLWGCTKVTNLIRFISLTFPKECCLSMYQNTGVRLSKTQTGSYTVPYRLPVSGTGTAGTNALQNMFGSTKGTFTGTPTINTTYYEYQE